MKPLVTIAVIFISVYCIAEWKAPSDPDPELILNEASLDVKARRYEDALAKHLWFHNHALDRDKSYSGVRLSFALRDWFDLGKLYRPAMVKLIETRDQDEHLVREGAKNVRDTFLDMVAINEILAEEDRTVAQFIWLDKNVPRVARDVYDLAQPTLVNAKKFNLCGKYLEPDKSYAILVQVRHSTIRSAERAKSVEPKRFRYEFADESFIEEAATLTALLVLNNRMSDATKIAELAKHESTHPERDLRLRTALEGKLPMRGPAKDAAAR